MKEYLGNPTATAKALTADQWLDTGDVGYVDDENFVFIADRAKVRLFLELNWSCPCHKLILVQDIIIRGGENIASAEVENAIARDGRIAEVAAVPVPCPRMGELVGVHVSLAPGLSSSDVSSHSVIQQVKDRLRYAALPAIVVVSDEPLRESRWRRATCANLDLSA
jgi:acyl-CoA synthetase (AMP-forming)/AMP-acid ligase II